MAQKKEYLWKRARGSTTHLVDDVRLLFIVRTDPHVPGLISTAPLEGMRFKREAEKLTD